MKNQPAPDWDVRLGQLRGPRGTRSPHGVLFSQGLKQGALPAERAAAAAQADGLTPEGVNPNEGFNRVTLPPNFKTSSTESVSGPEAGPQVRPQQEEASTCGTSLLL